MTRREFFRNEILKCRNNAAKLNELVSMLVKAEKESKPKKKTTKPKMNEQSDLSGHKE